MIKNWDYLRYYKINKKKILKIFEKCLLSGHLILGPGLEKFEKNFKNFIGVKYGLGVGNCTDAIYIALKALNLKIGDEVIVPSNTAIPTVTAIVNAGAIPRFVDVNSNYLINEKKIEKEINKKTKVILVVHLYGQTCDMDSISNLAKNYRLKIIEDCAQATGAKYKKKKAGNLGDIACFSFYPTKILGAYGDGGFIATNNKGLYEVMSKIRYMGIESKNNSKKYYATIHGTNSRLDEIQAVILDMKLKSLNQNIKRRRQIANLYNSILKDTSLILPNVSNHNFHVYYQYVVRHKNRKKILDFLKKIKINLNITYPYPIHKMTAYKNLSKHVSKLKNTEKFSREIFSLPVYPELKNSEIIKLSNTIKKNL
jgi:aminotransferase EvaB